MDWGSRSFLIAMKLLRWNVFWFAVYVACKAYQDKYVEKVLLGEQDTRTRAHEPADARPPPDLMSFVIYALALDLGICLLIATIVALVVAKFKAPDNTFILDWPLLQLAGFDYAMSTATLALLGVLLARVVQKPGIFRYREDGLRGIRAFSEVLLFSSAVVIAVPYYAFA